MPDRPPQSPADASTPEPRRSWIPEPIAAAGTAVAQRGRAVRDSGIMLRSLANGLLDMLAPRLCPGCAADLPPGAHGFCQVCEPLLEPLDGKLGMEAAYGYGGPMAEAIRALKYGRARDHAAPLAALLAERAMRHAGRVDAVVSVPLHRARLAERGFDQAALLARPVATKLGVPYLDGALERVRETAPQASLDGVKRAENVRGSFRAKLPRGVKRVLVIDDVRTTGATFAAAAEALRIAGAEEIETLALAGSEPG